jgi:hypothetical protein
MSTWVMLCQTFIYSWFQLSNAWTWTLLGPMKDAKMCGLLGHAMPDFHICSRFSLFGQFCLLCSKLHFVWCQVTHYHYVAAVQSLYLPLGSIMKDVMVWFQVVWAFCQSLLGTCHVRFSSAGDFQFLGHSLLFQTSSDFCWWLCLKLHVTYRTTGPVSTRTALFHLINILGLDWVQPRIIRLIWGLFWRDGRLTWARWEPVEQLK